MGIFEPGRRRLVEQRDHLKTGRCERVQRDKALGTGGVGGHADGGLDGLIRGRGDVGSVAQVASELAQEGGEEVGQYVAAPGQRHLGLRSGVGEQPFERPQHRPAGFVADGGGSQTEAQFAGGVRGDQGWPGVDSVEGDDG